MVMVISSDKKPLAPTNNARARMLLKKGSAVVHKIYPFVIRLKSKKDCNDTFSIKVDPGANTTGFAIVDKTKCLFLVELIHRGKAIKKALTSRRGVRRSRRNRKTRYRKPRFLNRVKPKGWLAPSVKSRADNIINFILKISKYIPIDKVVIESVSFDTTSMTQDKKLYGTDYQKGALYQTKLRDFLFTKYNGKCVYCGFNADEIEHIVPKSKGGTNSVNNLTISCKSCNILKGNKSLKVFAKEIGKDLTFLRPKKTPQSASIIQSARDYTIKELSKNFKVEAFEGWQTYLNRKSVGLEKEHYYDALCVGDSYNYKISTNQVLIIQAFGRGNRQMCRVDRYGFPRAKPKGAKFVKGFQTGDIVKAVVTKGKKTGEYFGKVAVRSSGNFNIKTSKATIQGISYKYCKLIQRGDGYAYNFKKTA